MKITTKGISGFTGAVCLALSGSALAYPVLDLKVSESKKDNRLLMSVGWNQSGPSIQCGAGECITGISIDLTAGDGESNAKWRNNISIVDTTGLPSNHISWSILDTPDLNDRDRSDRNMLSFMFTPSNTFDQGNGFEFTFGLTGLGDNSWDDFFRRGKEVLASAFLGDGRTYYGSDSFGRCDKAACAEIEFAAAPTAVPEPGSIALLSVGVAGLMFSRRRKI